MVCIVVLVAGTAFADGPQEGGISGQGESYACQECSKDTQYAYCDPSNPGYWANCKGGQICYWDAMRGWLCEPDCGGTRCYFV
jgi:hypothetical protein